VTRAAALFTQGCNDGAYLGCFGLAVLYREGKGVSKDPPRAATLFEKTCEEATEHDGRDGACMMLAMLPALASGS
jgi:TPR repeat protein